MSDIPPASFSVRLDDGETDERCVTIRQTLTLAISGSSAYHDATSELTSSIVARAERVWNSVKDLDPNQVDQPFENGPNLARDVRVTMGSIPEVCSAYSPNHPVHDFLIAFIKALQNLPDNNVHQCEENYNEDTEEWDISFPIVSHLWTRGAGGGSFAHEALQLDFP
ncbi:hypothetical protein VHEMI10152 [[Torrubiella] hemipterigena]|uniref:Uncharacterized protein n=1 Tax=[Torrubiella] hemipterigena TaxID=1531966 RepID=A0A0A1TRN8_9HYPO|nr:hypothetical protein VHEMI10152 [[Torrubiella] hemipterigena]